MSKLAGVFPVIQTPYHNDFTIDFDTLQREVDWLIQHGADGLVLAMVSEILRLSSEERDHYADRLCALAQNRVPVVISVGAESTHTALRHAHHAEAAGATALMAIPPVSIGLGRDQLLAYYRALLDAVRIPLIVQDASGYVGRPLPIDAQAQLLHDYGPDRVLFKPEAVPLGPNLTALREATKGRARVFEGSGGIGLVDAFRRGIVGTMPAAELIQAQVALWNALKTGDETRIYRLYQPLAALVALQSGLDGFLAVEKYLLHKQGIFKNTLVRGPVGFTLDSETCREVDRLFALLQQTLDTP